MLDVEESVEVPILSKLMEVLHQREEELWLDVGRGRVLEGGTHVGRLDAARLHLLLGLAGRDEQGDDLGALPESESERRPLGHLEHHAAMRGVREGCQGTWHMTWVQEHGMGTWHRSTA